MLSEEGPVFRNRPLFRYLVDFWISTDPLRFLTVEGLGDVSQLPKPGRVRRPPDPHDILRSDVRARIATPPLVAPLVFVGHSPSRNHFDSYDWGCFRSYHVDAIDVHFKSGVV